jgi:hypothetical protein
MRIVTRPDFDGVVCAALLYEAEDITGPVKWIEPNDLQKGLVEIFPQDILANLPFHPNCALWFDHHYTNKPALPFKGDFRLTPSAARLVFEYYREKFHRDYSYVVDMADKIDSAKLSLEEVLHPENHPYVILSMTLSGWEKADEPYWNRMVQLIRENNSQTAMQEPEVIRRCRKVVDENQRFKGILQTHTRVIDHVSVTDFRSLPDSLRGNRFLVYSLFPQTVVAVRVRYNKDEPDKVTIGVGHSIFLSGCNVNVGLMLSRFGGGGHRGAGSCTVGADKADETLAAILDILLKNEPNESPSP